MQESVPVLKLVKIGRSFGIDPIVHGLIDVDLQVNRGEWLAITGPSGAGKSTLLNVLGCLDRPSSGTYLFDGINTATLNDRQRAGLRSRRIGFVFQSFHLLPNRSVLENVMLAEVYGGQGKQEGGQNGRRDRALAVLERVGLLNRIDYLPTKLSGGERQRVAIARALVGSPSLLLCDEPTGNLDSKSTDSILALFGDANRQGLTIVVVTHDEAVAQQAQRRVRIVDGRLTEMTPLAVERSENEQRTLPQPFPLGGEACSPPQRGIEGGRSTDKSAMSLRDLFNEAIAGIFSRLGRTILTILGIMIGLTALVATLGLSRTASNRVISQFDELAATEIFITGRGSVVGTDPRAIPWDAAERLQRLNGVVAAGTVGEVELGDELVRASLVSNPQAQTAFNLSLKLASAGLFTAVRAELRNGRFPDQGHSQRADRVAVLGPNAAQRLGIVGVEQLPAIAIGDQLYLVIGILDSVARQPDLLGAVIIPEGTARRDFGLIGPGTVVVETHIGATSLIARQAPLALRPDNPRAVQVELAPEPQRVRDAVASDLNVMFLLLGGLSLVVGAIGIGNVTLVSVIERTGEIGLRRAIGATRSHIATQFLLESSAMGLIGGILGACVGLLVVVAVAAYQVWTPVLDPIAPFLAPLVGGLIGLVSGTYPALRAARLEPVEAFRTGT